jgi:cation diffusion facilitator family transporter
MAHESKTAVYVGIGATLLIAATKFAAAYFSGSSAMVSEGVHSLVDSADGLLLLLGLHRAKRPPDAGHPLGHGKELYFWALIVSLLFFALGGGVSLYEGVQHILHPEPITDPGWSYVVLASSAVFTFGSLVVSLKGFRAEKGERSYWAAFRRSKDPTFFTLVLEDLADIIGIGIAALGIFLGHYFHNPYLDGAASIGVGLVLAGVAVLLARESKGLLIGEGASERELAAISSAARGDPDVVAVRRPVTIYFGPRSVLVAMDVEFRPELTTAQVADAVDRLESRMREQDPDIKHIYIEAEALRRAGVGSRSSA